MESQQILRMLRRRGWIIIAWTVALGVIVGGASYFLQTPVYETSAQVLLQQNDPSQSNQPGAQIDAASFAASQVLVVRSPAVTRAAAAKLPGHPSPDVVLSQVRVLISPTSSLLTITASSSDPAQAQATANALATTYIANSRQRRIANLRAAVNDLTPQLNALQRQIAALDAQIRTARTKAGGLQARRDATFVQYQALFAQQAALRVQIKLTHGQAQLSSAAGLPSSPVSPKPLKDAALGATAGFLIGVGIVLLREKLDDNVGSAEELAADHHPPRARRDPRR